MAAKLYFCISVEKPKPVVSGRSNSFDNVMAAPYLSGQWPKDGQWAQKDISVTPSQSIPSANLGAFTHDKQTQVSRSIHQTEPLATLNRTYRR